MYLLPDKACSRKDEQSHVNNGQLVCNNNVLLLKLEVTHLDYSCPATIATTASQTLVYRFTDGFLSLNLSEAKIHNLNFQPLEVVSRYRDPQHQVVENYSYLFNLRPTVCKY